MKRSNAVSQARPSLLARFTALCLIPVTFLYSPVFVEAANESAFEQAKEQAEKQIHPDPVVSSSPVSINRTLPAFTPANSHYILPTDPTDHDLFVRSHFSEPLIPVGGKTTLAENQSLGHALTSFATRSDQDSVGSLENFLAAYPQSPWRIALLVNLGLIYRHTGWYSKAMAAWEQAWQAGKDLKDLSGKPLIDRALAELIVMNARVGRMETLKELIQEANGRHLIGSSKEKLESAEQALVLMQTRPDTSIGWLCQREGSNPGVPSHERKVRRRCRLPPPESPLEF